MSNFQRPGAISNAHVGRAFEDRARAILAARGMAVEPNFRLPVGIDAIRKAHRFDLGSSEPPLVIECKCQTWTSGGRVPSAKMKNWAEAMFYFHMAPPEYRKIFLVEQSLNPRTGESLLAYFLRTQAHMIPDKVEFWELARHGDEIIVHDPKVPGCGVVQTP